MYTIASLQRPAYEADTSSAQIRAAGIPSKSKPGDTAKASLTWQAPPSTPPEQHKYRALHVYEAGKIARHWGSADDPVPQGPFGKRGENRDSAAKVMTGSYPTTEMGRWRLEQREDIYASSKQEPLGKGYQRGHAIPNGLGTDAPCGMRVDAKAKARAGQVKHIVFPEEAPPPEEDARAQELYVRSHGSYLPGEQRRRNYDWSKPALDPSTHRFGAVDSEEQRGQGVRQVLQPELEAPPPATVSRVLADFKLSASEPLGAGRKLGTAGTSLPADFVYGMPSLRNGKRGPSVADLLTQALTPEQQAPDATLGKSVREGWRNIAPEGRTFGVPSIRMDIPMPSTRSVACTSNYGNEPNVMQLLRPPKSVERGVNEEHLMQLRSRPEIRELLQEADIVLDDEQYDAVFALAAEADGAGPDKACLDTLLKARHWLLAQSATGASNAA